MINKTRASNLQPFSGLTPEVVLDAAAAFGLAPDGRLFALNSYENRVYQLGAGDSQLVLSVRGDLFEQAGRHDQAMAAFTEAAARSAICSAWRAFCSTRRMVLPSALSSRSV